MFKYKYNNKPMTTGAKDKKAQVDELLLMIIGDCPPDTRTSEEYLEDLEKMTPEERHMASLERLCKLPLESRVVATEPMHQIKQAGLGDYMSELMDALAKKVDHWANWRECIVIFNRSRR